MSSANWAIVHFEELPLRKGDLEHLAKDSLALFAISSYAVSELNSIARIMLSVVHVPENDDVVNAAGFIQQACVLRIWTHKLFEFHECISRLSKGKDKAIDEVRSLTDGFVRQFEDELALMDAFELARNVRNEAAAHYSFHSAKKNLPYVEPHGMADLMVNKRSGNSFYPFGEEVMFVGRLNRHGARITEKGKRDTLLNELFQWNKRANQWVTACHLSIFGELIAPSLSGRYKRKRAYWILPKKVGVLADFNVPLFARIDHGVTP